MKALLLFALVGSATAHAESFAVQCQTDAGAFVAKAQIDLATKLGSVEFATPPADGFWNYTVASVAPDLWNAKYALEIYSTVAPGIGERPTGASMISLYAPANLESNFIARGEISIVGGGYQSDYPSVVCTGIRE